MNLNVKALTIMKTQDAKLRGEPSTIGMSDLRRICCATRSILLK